MCTPAAHAVVLPQVHGDVGVFASSRAPPALALCRLGRSGLQPAASVPLAPPSGVPDGSTLRMRGICVQPAEAGGGSQLTVWVLLGAAQMGAAAPFLSASLSSRLYGSSKQQLWLSCYQLAAPGAAAAAAPSPHAGAPASTAAALGTAATAAAVGLAAAAAQPETPEAAAPVPAAQQAPPPAVEAALALQRAVAELRQEVNGRLDGLEACIGQLLQALQPQP